MTRPYALTAHPGDDACSRIRRLFEASRAQLDTELDLYGSRVSVGLAPRVFPPMPVSLAMAEHLPDLTGASVADVGTGTGILSIAAALRGAASVVATDLNPAAVELAGLNFARNGLTERVSVTLANWLPNRPQRFDVIVSNPPCMPVPCGEPGTVLPDHLRLAVDGGPSGDSALIRLIGLAAERLHRNGTLIVPVPGWSSAEPVWAALRRLGTARELCQINVPYWIPFVCPSAADWHPLAGLPRDPYMVRVVAVSKHTERGQHRWTEA